MAKKKLTIHDLLAGQARSYAGLGLYGSTMRTAFGWRLTRSPHTFATLVDTTILDLANAMGWTADDLHLFMDSRDGRYCGDALCGLNNTESQPSDVRRVLETSMREAIDDLRAEAVTA